MKVFHINSNYMTTSLHQIMVEHLNQLKIQNSVFAPIAFGVQITTRPNNYVTVSECFNKNDRYIFTLKQKKIIESAEKAFDLSQYDCIHAYTLFTDGNAAMRLAIKYNKPYVVAVRATDIAFFKKRINLRRIGIRILRGASKVFFLSEVTKNAVIDTYIPLKYRVEIDKKSIIIPNGIDDFWLDNIYTDSRILKAKEIDVICVAKIIKRKGIPLLQQAIRLMNERGYKCRLSLVGEPVDEVEYSKIINDPYTKHYNTVPKEELIRYYRKSDVFALISSGETFGLVYAEAMSQGLPVIYSAGEGFDGQFENGTVGYSTPPVAKMIADSIENVIFRYPEISSNCVNMCTKYDWHSIAGKYYSMYCEITHKG